MSLRFAWSGKDNIRRRDGCGIIKTSSDVFYRYSYGDDEVKDGNNELFWELFGIDIKDLRDIFWQYSR